MKYSLTKGINKGLISVVTTLIAVATLTGISDMTITGLIEEHLFPLLSGLTVAGVLTMVLNYIKVTSA